MVKALYRWSSIRDPVRVFGLAFLLLLLAGCGTTGHLSAPTEEDAAPFADGAIQVGDVVKVTFPGAANLNFTQQVRVDGILSLDQSRQILVVDKTSQQVKEELLALFGPELIIKEVNVMVESAGFPIYVSGAVLRPGKVVGFPHGFTGPPPVTWIQRAA